jgi:hypothetical protein
MVYACLLAWPASRWKIGLACGTAAVAVSSVAVALLGQRWHRDFASYYDALLQTEVISTEFNRESGSAQPICVLTPRVYPFFGSARQYRPCQPFAAPSGDAMLQYLRARRPATMVLEFYFHELVDVITFDAGGTECLNAHPELFEPLRTKYPLMYARLHVDALAVTADTDVVEPVTGGR